MIETAHDEERSSDEQNVYVENECNCEELEQRSRSWSTITSPGAERKKKTEKTRSCQL